MDEREIFLDAYAIEDETDRERFLDETCGRDSALRERIAELLGLAARAGRFLEPEIIRTQGASSPCPTTESGPAGSLEASDSAFAVSPQAETIIGPYRLLQSIGEGGMGTVYLAEQTQPLRRLVALKVIRPGLDSGHVLARFNAERQALALMDHPNIAKVLDAGTTAVGRPYFVMELVKGWPITQFCDDRKLTPRDRLELFIPVCQAVQHAHQKGIIHRDLKPSNVIVGLYDGVPVPKIIDFGVAKAIDQPLTEETIFTGFGVVVGTPEYMSPEQAQLDNVDIDTRSDVYSLGVLLYELLTGTTPLKRDRVRSAALLEILRLVREEEPPRPSARLSTTQELPSIAANRSIEPRRLSTLVRGELDWIVMKALEKNRARRYETANGLASDLRRYLDGEPVSACPPSATYQLSKFARRHRVLIGVLGAVLTTLICGIAISIRFAWIATRHAADADRQTRIAREAGDQATLRLHDSLVERARATLTSERIGQRLRTLETVAEALAIRPSGELRDLAISAMALPDVEFLPMESLPAGAQPISFDREFRRCVVHYGGKIIEVIDRATRRVLLHLEGTGAEQSGLLSPDGRWLLHFDSPVQSSVWRLDRPESPHGLLPSSNYVSGSFDHESRYVAVLQSGRATVYRLEPFEEVFSLPQRPVRGFAFHPQRPEAAISVGTQALVVSLSDGAPLASLEHGATVEFLTWHPDGRRLATATSTRLHLWDVPRGEKLATVPGDTSGGDFLEFADGGSVLVSYGWAGQVRFTEVDPVRQTFVVLGEWTARHLRSGPEGMIFAFDEITQAFPLARYIKATELITVEPRNAVSDVVYPGFHASGAWWVTGVKKYGSLEFRNPDGDLSARVSIPWRLHEVRIDKANHGLYTSTSDGLFRWPIEPNGASGWRIGPPKRQADLGSNLFEISADGSRILRYSLTNQALSHRPDEPEGLEILAEGYWGAQSGSALSPDGNLAAMGSLYSSLVSICDTRTGETIHRIPTRSYSPCFSPDGSLLLLTGSPTRPELYRVGTWEKLREYDLAYRGTFSPDGSSIAFEEGTGVFRIVETSTGRTLGRFRHPDGSRGLPGFSPDGRMLYATRIDGNAVFLWDLTRIRSRLSKMGIAWDAPTLGRPRTASETFANVSIELDFGDPDDHPPGSALNLAARGMTLERIEERLARNPDDAEALAVRGLFAARRSDYAKALVDLDRALALDPGQALAYAERGAIHSARGDDHQAAADYERALERHADAPLLRNNLAWIYVSGPEDLRKPKRALELAREAIARDPDNPLVANTFGVALYRTGQFEEAILVFLRNASRSENDLPCFDWLFAAMCHHRLGRSEEALKAFERACRMESSFANQGSSIVTEWKALKREAENVLGGPPGFRTASLPEWPQSVFAEP